MSGEPATGAATGEPDERRRFVLVAVAGSVLAALVRVAFFQGLWPADSTWHVRYALEWNHLPVNHWETRLLFNTLLHVAVQVFGRNEVAYALPSLLSSLATLLSATFLAWRHHSVRAAALAAVMIAVLPGDVIYATVPIAGSLATALVSLGVAVYFGTAFRWTSPTAAALFAAAALAHPTAIFFVAALLLAAAVVSRDPLSRRRAAVCLAMTIVVYLVVDLTLFWLLTGDPTYEFRIIPRTSPRDDPFVPTFSAAWFLFPARAFLFSKEFGFVLAIGAVLVTRAWPTLSSHVRVMCVSMIAYWLWAGYGTQSPFEFRPFWREPRWGHLFVTPLSVVLAFVLLELPRRTRHLVVAFVVISSLGILALSGSWGQDVAINKEFLPYVRAHGSTLFFADAESLRELYVLNQCRPLPNVSADPGAARGWRGDLRALDNPLTGKALIPAGYTVGPSVFTTRVAYRPIAVLLPRRLVEQVGWFIRRPEAHIVELVPLARGGAPHDYRRSVRTLDTNHATIKPAPAPSSPQ